MQMIRKLAAGGMFLVAAGFTQTTLVTPRAYATDTTPATVPVAQSVGNADTTTTGQDTSTTVACPMQKPLPASDAHAALQILPSTRWQPYGGDVQFELTGVGGALPQVSVYFAWPEGADHKPSVCLLSPRVRLLPALDDDAGTTYRYAARVPDLDDSWVSGWRHWSFPNPVPQADFYVTGADSSGNPQAVFISFAGISTPWIALTSALALGVIVFAALACWSRRRNIPGGPFLGIISTPHGVASLSQFQILIWTYVIGVGVVYVMMMSGNLIDIPTSTLSLLGITGFALVGSKIQANAYGSPQLVGPPGAVTQLSVVGTPTSDTVVLSWMPPVGTAQPVSYTIQWRDVGQGSWTTAAHGIAAPPYAVIALLPGTSYAFQVFAMNAGGAGPASVLVSALTAAALSAAGGQAPNQVTGVAAEAQKNGTVKVSWSLLAPAPDGYIVQYRPTGELPWSTYNAKANPPVYVDKLDSGSSYQFQVYAQTKGSSSPPSALADAKTTPRQPQWSDLVMSGDDNTEVDLSRLQMLVFTTITAVFTALTLMSTGVIPDLPVGELALVGISNGVYLASKVSKGN